MRPTLKSAGEDKTEIPGLRAIVIAGQAIHVPQRHRERHRKALRGKEECRTVGEAQIQRVHVPRGFRFQLSVVEATIAPELILELMRIGISGGERQPGEQPDRARELRLHEIAQAAADLGSKLGQIG